MKLRDPFNLLELLEVSVLFIVMSDCLFSILNAFLVNINC